MAIVKMSPPWITFYRKIKALFQKDPEIKVIFDEDEMEVKIYVENNVKADALTSILPMVKEFGNVTIDVTVIPNNSKDTKKLELYTNSNAFEIAFDNNGAVDMIKNIQLGAQNFTYIVFNKEDVQFFTDDLSDLYGLSSTLYQDIAKEIFEDVRGVFFCTNSKDCSTLTLRNMFADSAITTSSTF